MTYNYDKRINRWGTRSEKWDGMKEMYGTKDLLPLWEADLDFECAPAIQEALRKRAAHGVYGYTMRDDAFFQSIIDWQKRRNGWTIEKDWIRNTAGAIPAVSVAVNAFTEPGDKIIIQEPVYYRFFNSITMNGRESVHNTMIYKDGKYQIDFEDLEKQIDEKTKMMIICNPQNPVGKVFTEEELFKIGEICLKHNIIILSDEIYSDIIFSGHKHIPMASLSKEFEQNTMTIFGPGKGFNLPGLKATIVSIANPKLREKFDYVADAMQICLKNLFAIEAIPAAYNDAEKWLDETVAYLEENKNFMVNYVRENIPEVDIVEPEGTYIAWMDFNKLGLTDEELEKMALEDMKVGFKYGYTFGQGGSGFQRVNFGCPRSMLLEGLQRIERAVKAYLKNKESKNQLVI